MTTNEQAKLIIESKLISTTELAARFYGLGEDATARERNMKSSVFARRTNFSDEELAILRGIVIDELQEMGILAANQPYLVDLLQKAKEIAERL